MTAPLPGAWPLSAAATALLREPGTSGSAVLKLALRELVVRGVLGAELGEPRRFRPRTLTLHPGAQPATGLPAPLPRSAAALLAHVPPGGADATKVVRQAVGRRHELVDELLTATRAHLEAQGLLTAERSKVLGVVPRTRWRRTPTGEVWAAVPRGLERDPGAALTGAGVPPSGVPAVGLLLALDEEVARALREDDDGAVHSAHGDVDGRTLDAVLGDVGSGLDSAVDGGSGSSGDGGGDGGGGGD
jgi:hypothetical protein